MELDAAGLITTLIPVMAHSRCSWLVAFAWREKSCGLVQTDICFTAQQLSSLNSVQKMRSGSFIKTNVAPDTDRTWLIILPPRHDPIPQGFPNSTVSFYPLPARLQTAAQSWC